MKEEERETRSDAFRRRWRLLPILPLLDGHFLRPDFQVPHRLTGEYSPVQVVFLDWGEVCEADGGRGDS